MWSQAKTLARRNHDKIPEWEEFDELMEEQILKEWKKFGYTSRDWQKVKLIFFSEDGKPKAMKSAEYRKMTEEKLKEKMKNGLKPDQNEKKMK